MVGNMVVPDELSVMPRVRPGQGRQQRAGRQLGREEGVKSVGEVHFRVLAQGEGGASGSRPWKEHDSEDRAAMPARAPAYSFLLPGYSGRTHATRRDG